jgi:aspartate racemase
VFLHISCDPRIPKRPAAILDGGESPLPRLREIRDRLLAAGATALVMPCNTAHHWYDELAADCPVPFLSIVEAGSLEALRLAAPVRALARATVAHWRQAPLSEGGATR